MCVGRGVRSVYVCWEGGGECVCRPYLHVSAYGVCVCVCVGVECA